MNCHGLALHSEAEAALSSSNGIEAEIIEVFASKIMRLRLPAVSVAMAEACMMSLAESQMRLLASKEYLCPTVRYPASQVLQEAFSLVNNSF